MSSSFAVCLHAGRNARLDSTRLLLVRDHPTEDFPPNGATWPAANPGEITYWTPNQKALQS